MQTGWGCRSNTMFTRWEIWLIVALLFFVAPEPSWARGGGGCLAEGTRVLTPEGPVAVEKLKEGDAIWSVIDGKLQKAKVQAIVKVRPENYMEISAGDAGLDVTPEHPMMTARGEYRFAGRLRAGDTVYLAHHGKLEEAPVRSIRQIRAKGPAYNLLVFPGGTFIAEKFLLHNKGCFLPDTQILKSDGHESPIHAVRPGEEVLAFSPEGRLVRTKVREVIRQQADEYVLLKTDRATLQVTQEHPFYAGNGTFKTVESLREGDRVFAWDGQWLTEQRIASLERVRERVQVFNLQTDQPHTFFAGRMAVHNKGGCFPAGTQIATPRGPVAIDSLASGEDILAVTGDGRTVRSTVESVFVSKDTLVKIKTGGGDLVTTAEHPVSLAGGKFKQARDLHPGDRIVKWKKGRLTVKAVRKVLFTEDEALVFDLRVGEPHTYVAEEIVVHNKGGGCFPTGTPIRTPQGQTSIEKLSPGDCVLAVGPEGRMTQARVDQIFATRSLVLSVVTDHGSLRTTADHPLETPGDNFVPAGQLRPGQKVLVWEEGGVQSATVIQTMLEGQEHEVYNLSVGWPNTFLAADFVTHNKGGSSSRSSSSSSRSSSSSSGSSSADDAIFGAIAVFGAISVFAVIIVIMARARSHTKEENLDFVYDRNKISPKAAKTEKLLAFLSQQDSAVSPEDLRKLTESTFRKLQECWQEREYSPMQPLLMADLFAQHTAQLQGLVRDHEIDRIENLKVEHVDLVNIRYTEKPDQREFTALVTASARDYYVDDRTGKFLRGDREPARFQEFWTFHRLGDQWLLREIEQAGESDILKDENFIEMLTDDTLRGIYGEVAGEKGEAGPWLEKEAEKKATRIEHMLNFLAQTDKLWNRSQMLERARRVFLSVYLARESGDPGRVPSADLFPQVAESLRAQIRQWQEQGLNVEYRNLCVRKAELILVRNFADPAKDEFTARINAHAQRIIHKGDQIRSEQQDVTPFEEYWVFGRLDNQWKLKEVLPSALGRKKLVEENVDEDSSQSQLQWYYRQTRAQ